MKIIRNTCHLSLLKKTFFFLEMKMKKNFHFKKGHKNKNVKDMNIVIQNDKLEIICASKV